MSAKIDKREVWHVYPVRDLKPHAVEGFANECECHPRVRQEGKGFVVLHNSFDGREVFESR